MNKVYLIVDNEFNRQWYHDLIGKTVPVPPSYAHVREVDAPAEQAPEGEKTLDEVVFG